MEDIVKDIIDELNSEIKKQQEMVRFIEEMDFGKRVDRKTWETLCHTPLKETKIMEKVLKNVFPDAEDIVTCFKGIEFSLYGFKCWISKEDACPVEVDTSWYCKKDESVACGTDMTRNMRNYFRLKENNAGWEELFDCRIPSKSNYPKWKKWLLWNLIYRFKSDNKELWDFVFQAEEKEFEKAKLNLEQRKQESREESIKMAQVLLPELHNFSEEIGTIRERSSYSVEDILRMEDIKVCL